MAASLPKKVAYRDERGGNADPTTSLQRAQRMAQQLAQTVEQLKTYVTSLASTLAVLVNTVYVALAVDVTINVAAYATLLSATITTTLQNGNIDIRWTSAATNAVACSLFYQVVVDGVVTKGTRADVVAGGTTGSSMLIRVPVQKGTHTVLLQWKTNVNGGSIHALTVVEQHASLIVQESP